MENFISAEQFDLSKSQHDAIVPWRDVPVGVIYLIEDVEEISTKVGKANVLGLVNANDERVRAFSASILDKDLVDLNWSVPWYIKSLGLKQSSSSDRSYYQYELVKTDE